MCRPLPFCAFQHAIELQTMNMYRQRSANSHSEFRERLNSCNETHSSQCPGGGGASVAGDHDEVFNPLTSPTRWAIPRIEHLMGRVRWWQDAIAAVDSFEPPPFPPMLIVRPFFSPPTPHLCDQSSVANRIDITPCQVAELVAIPWETGPNISINSNINRTLEQWDWDLRMRCPAWWRLDRRSSRQTNSAAVPIDEEVSWRSTTLAFPICSVCHGAIANSYANLGSISRSNPCKWKSFSKVFR